MSNPLRFLFCLLVLVVSFQLIGFEQAFCEDSAMEGDCQDCATCVLNHFARLESPNLLPMVNFLSFTYFNEPALNLEEPTFSFFRPPISL